MKGTTIVGIDPGVSGGYTYNTEAGIDICKWKDARTSFAILESLMTHCMLENRTLRVYLEKVYASPIMSQSSAFSFGFNYGQWCGILECLNIEWVDVPPSRWQMGLDKPKDLKGPPLKRWLKEKAIDMFPDQRKKITLTTCDGLLIHQYGMNKR